MPLKPNTKAELFNQTGQSANSDIFTSNVTASEPPTEFVIEGAFNNATRLNVTEFDGSETKSFHLNDNSTFAANDLTRVRHLARNGSEYNYQPQSACDVELLVIAEEHLGGE